MSCVSSCYSYSVAKTLVVQVPWSQPFSQNAVDLTGRRPVIFMGNDAILILVPAFCAGEEIDCSCSCKAAHGGDEQ